MSTILLYWELRQCFRQGWFANVRRLYTGLVLAWFAWYAFDMFVTVATTSMHFRLQRFLWICDVHRGEILTMHGLAVFALTPIFAVTSVAQAINRGVLDLLLTTRERPLTIVVHVVLATAAKVVLVTLPGVPLVLWIHGVHGIPWWVTLIWLACLWLITLPIAAWSVLAMLSMRRVAAAICLAYVGVLALGPAIYYVLTEAQLTHWVRGQFELVSWETFAQFLSVPTISFVLVSAFRLRAWHERDRSITSLKGAIVCPPVGDEPFYWKQFYFHDFSRMGWLGRLPSRARLFLFVILSCVACSSPPGMMDGTPYVEAVLILIGFPLGALLAAASTASVERESATWDALRVTMLGADEYTKQTLDAVLVRIKPYWVAMLPAVLILACKRHEIGLVVPFVWLIAGSLMRPAAIIGLYFSVKSDSGAGSLLQAMMWYFATVIGAGILVLGCLIVAMVLIEEFTPMKIHHVMYYTRRSNALTTLLHLLCTWLLLRLWFHWYANRQFSRAIAHLAGNERMDPPIQLATTIPPAINAPAL